MAAALLEFTRVDGITANFAFLLSDLYFNPKFNATILVALSMCSESFMTRTVSIFQQYCQGTAIKNRTNGPVAHPTIEKKYILSNP